MSTVRNEVANFLAAQRKGEVFTTTDLYSGANLYNSSEEKTARNRLAEFAQLGLVTRVSTGTYKVTSSSQTRKQHAN